MENAVFPLIRATATKLAALFIENFKKFETAAAADVTAAGPTAKSIEIEEPKVEAEYVASPR